jgi:hypothetical protein
LQGIGQFSRAGTQLPWVRAVREPAAIGTGDTSGSRGSSSGA